MFKKLLHHLKNISLVLFLALILGLTVRGYAGNPTQEEILQQTWTDNGPFELSPERGRFALLYSLVENNSFQFSVPLAKFTTPDVGYSNGHYVSLFAPGVSFIAMPGYIIGKLLGYSQVGSFLTVAVFAIANVFLVRKIIKFLGLSEAAGTIAALVFLFATPAFAYSVTLYQHHISTFIILLSLYLVLRYNNLKSLALLWFLCAASIAIDYPNLFMMLPIGVAGLAKFFKFHELKDRFEIKFLPTRLFTFLAVIVPLALFMWFNYSSYQNPFQLSGGVNRIEKIDEQGRPILLEQEIASGEIDHEEKQNVVSFFSSRNIIYGLYEHFISLDRGMLFYTPVMFLGIVGYALAIRKSLQARALSEHQRLPANLNPKSLSLLITVMGMNIFLYSMWGDPYGGWAFGSRYFIPTYALLGIGIAVLLHYWREKLAFHIIFFILLVYSVAVGSLGAVTSNRNPPQVEIAFLQTQTGRKEYYTVQRNVEYLENDVVKSFVYQTYAKNTLNSYQYYSIVMGSIVFVFIYLLTLYTHHSLKRLKSQEVRI